MANETSFNNLFELDNLTYLKANGKIFDGDAYGNDDMGFRVKGSFKNGI